MSINSSILIFDGGRLDPQKKQIGKTTITGGRGPQGPQGEQGPAGEAKNTLDSIAGEDISVYDVVRVHNGAFFKASPSDDSTIQGIIGVALQSVIAGESITVMAQGRIKDINFGFPISGKLFCGANGKIVTQSNFSNIAQIGFIEDSQQIFINIQRIIKNV